MRAKYYKIPLNTRELLSTKREKPKLYVSLKKSLQDHIELLLMTAFQELKYDHDYGTILSALDFSTEKQSGIFERSIAISVEESICKYETRLEDVRVKVKYDRMGEIVRQKDQSTFKIFILIEIEATIHKFKEPFYHEYKLYFSPLTES